MTGLSFLVSLSPAPARISPLAHHLLLSLCRGNNSNSNNNYDASTSRKAQTFQQKDFRMMAPDEGEGERLAEKKEDLG